MLEYLPSGDTSRIRGLPDTCRIVAPAPINNTAKRMTGKLKARIGNIAPNKKSINPIVNIFFFPIRDWVTPIGTDNTPNMIIPENDTKEAVSGVILNAVSTIDTNWPAASPKPMARKTKKTEIRDSCFFIFSILMINLQRYKK